MIPVVVRNVKIGAGIPKICVPIVGKTSEEIFEAAKVIKRLPADIVEWRVDWFEDVFESEKVEMVLSELRSILEEMPILFTFRTADEGGERKIDDAAYLVLNKSVIDTKYVDLVDVEIYSKETIASELIDYAQQNDVRVIASNHDFEKTPEQKEIVARLERMQELGADILKIAVMPNCEQDVQTLLSATKEMAKESKQPLVTMSMSEMGMISRTSGEACGSAMTFGEAGKTSAPGQILVEELKEILEGFHQSWIKKG